MTTPDVSDVSDYGMPEGGFEDFEIPVVNPVTDQPAAGANAMMCDTAQMTHTAARAWCRFVGNATVPVLANVNGSDAMWGNESGVLPLLVEVSTGVYTVTWPATVQDELGVEHNTNLRWARASCEDAAGFFRAKVTAPNVVTVTCTDHSNTASDFVGDIILVEAG